jgi:serine/threonine protein kinase
MSDVFSLGVILWEIATGHRIFDGKEDTFSIIHHVVEMKERPPILDTIPSDFAELIQWCWQEGPSPHGAVATAVIRSASWFILGFFVFCLFCFLFVSDLSY